MDERNNTLVEERITQSDEFNFDEQKQNKAQGIFSSAKTFKSLTAIVSMVCIYGLYYWGIPAVVDLPNKAEIIEQTVLKESGYKISVKNPKIKMGFIPSVWLNADSVSVLNDDKSKAFDLQKPSVKIKLLPLILKKIDIDYFSADNISTNLVFDKQSQLKLGQYPINIQKINSPFKLHHAVIRLDSYEVNLKDELQSKNIKLNGQYLYINDFKLNKHLDLSTIANLYVGNKASFIKSDIDLKLPLNNIAEDQLQISGHIANLNLADFSPYAKSISKGQIKSISGLINFTADTKNTPDKHKQIQTELYLTNFSMLKDDIASSMYYKDKLAIKADVTTFKNGIDINEMSVKGKGIDTHLNGTVSKLNAKLPVLNLNATINKSNIEDILPILPGEKDLSPDIDLHLLKQTGFWGNIMGNLEIKGKADYPDVKGNILVNNGYLLQPIPNADKATIKMVFKGQKLDLDVSVPTSKTQTVFVKGPIEIYKNKNADLMITSTNDVDLKTAQIVLNPLHDILHFDLGPVPIMDIRGKGGIDLHVVGTRKNPHGWGNFHFRDASVSFLDIHNMQISQGSGILTFDDQNTQFTTKSARLNGKPVSIDGTCSLLGNLDFKVKANGQDFGNILKIIKTSPMLVDIQKLIEPIENGKGNSDFYLNLTGQVKDVNDIVFNKNLFAKGHVNLHSNTMYLKVLPVAVSNIKGVVNFDNLNADFKLVSNLNKSEMNIEGKIKDNTCNTKISSNRFNAGDALTTLPKSVKIPYKDDIAKINLSFNAKYNGKLDKIDYDKISAKGRIYSNKGAAKSFIIDNSNFELNNSNFRLSTLRGSLKDSPFMLAANIDNLFDKKKQNINGTFNIQKLDLNLINDEKLKNILSPDVAKAFADCKDLTGNVNLSAKIRNNNLNAYTVLDNIAMTYVPKHLKISIKSGSILLRNDVLNLNKLNAQLGVMPVFISGKVSNVYKKPDMNLYINAKPSQEFFDQFFNNKAVYPIKVKGDIIWTSKVSGTIDNFNTNSELKVNENSSIYYMGASIGDVENPVRISIDNNYSPNKIKVHNLQYDKIINSQNNKPFVNTQLNASGSINLLSDGNIGFNNFKVKTENPTDAKIFNIIFRKPTMKQGVFTSDLVLNGTSANPKVRGKLDISSIDMPFFDSTIKDVNLDFKHDNILITSRGTVLTNDVHLNAVMKNKLIPPYIIEDVKVKLADLDINKITDTMRDLEVDSSRNPSAGQTSSQAFDLSQVVIKKAEVLADKIKVRNISADNFIANLSLNEKMLLNIDKFKFNIANGSVLGSFQYNLLSHKTTLNVHLDDANSNMMAEALFDLKGQIYGLASGDINLVCNGTNHETCFKTMSGEGYFSVDNGKMPKLGSLEYLLKAGNLIRGGFTGLSINSLIDLITPLKTGEFESISGDFHIANGIAQKINIYSNGNDLNMYMTGSYNFVNSIADMQIYGSLSKNITSVFGKVKNASLNTLFNTIPGLSTSDETYLLQNEINKIPSIKNGTSIYRIFAADIYGDINGENYVRSFKWVK